MTGRGRGRRGGRTAKSSSVDGRASVLPITSEVIQAKTNPDAPGDTRCVLNDGKRWRCKETRADGQKFCDKHCKQHVKGWSSLNNTKRVESSPGVSLAEEGGGSGGARGAAREGSSLGAAEGSSGTDGVPGTASRASAGSDAHAERDAEPQGLKEMLRAKVAEYAVQVSQLEQQMAMIAKLQPSSATDKENASLPIVQTQESVEKESITAQIKKRSEALIRQFNVIFNKICKHKWAWPFMTPVDPVDLNLPDYFEVIEKPMDLGTIKTRMDAAGYQSVKDFCSDMRLVFANAMLYNKPGTDVYLMALKLSLMFEEWWLNNLSKKVEQLEKDIQQHEIATSSAKAVNTSENLSKSVTVQIEELEKELVSLRQQALSRKRPMTLAEKHQLGNRLLQLPPHKYDRALNIILDCAPAVSTRGDEIDVDITALDSAALWRLHHFIRVSASSDPYSLTDDSTPNNVL